ncbi:amidohydrolase [Colwellia psychrerythraea]|uniref:Putative lipoprotein n=1 Tax=Colwellia psychrerythraea (strain 34H / ATCC BAA-681) TaxID=167879 RepID=Q483G5_COLP3|nr:amidohydrolase [Colwellia psychrerythraea]AAZ24744.1 putative lipoprotein [Colwellia psychrerythraea 34H]
MKLSQKINKIFYTLFLAVFMFSCSVDESKETLPKTQTSQSISSIYYGGDILTMVGDSPHYVEAVVESEGRIVFTGDKSKALNFTKNTLNHVNLQGKTMLPGFIDGHGHVVNTGLQSLLANLLPAPDGGAQSHADIVDIMTAWSNDSNNQEVINSLGWIMGLGYDDGQLAEKAHPSAEVLDKISTEIPILLIHQSGHFGAMNSKAIELLGLTAASKDPQGGVYRRNPDGTPNGVLEENAFFNSFYPILGKMTQELKDKSFIAGQLSYASFGYTTAQDGRSMADESATMARASQANKLLIDVVSYPDIIVNRKSLTTQYNSAQYTNKYRIAGAKLTLDGSPQGKTAWLSEPYHAPPFGQNAHYAGYGVITNDEAAKYLSDAFENNWQIITHANGDKAIDQLVYAINIAAKQHGNEDRRPVLIHGQTLRADQIQSLVKLKIFPSLFPMHTFYWGDWHVESVLGHPRADFISPTKSVLEAGLKFTSHHDSPVTKPSSLRVLDATVNRTTRSGVILGPSERVSPYIALKALTDWAAYQHFEEKNKGTITVGKQADFVILDKNPLKIEKVNLGKLKILQTISYGETVYQSE